MSGHGCGPGCGFCGRCTEYYDGTDDARDEWEGPRSCCADFAAIISTERTGHVYKCPVCKFVFAVPFEADFPKDAA